MKPKIIHAIVPALALALGLPAPLLAQTAASSPPTTAAGEQTIVLSPFVVNVDHDNGYIAVDSLSGGRMDAPIRVTPAPMSSLTSGFINDLELTNINDVLKWSLSTVPTADRNGLAGGSGGGVFNYWSISTRGGQSVQGGNPPTKNYFPIFRVMDTYNIERVEFDQGPNSILFGIGDIGGAVSSYTKMARFDKNFQNLSARVDSYGGYRGTIDVNQSAGNLAVRVNGVAANEKGWRDGDYHHKLGGDVAATFKFNEGKSQLRFEIEGWKEKKAIYGASYQDNFSLWDGTTSAATWGAAIANQGANPQTTPGAPGVTGMSDWGLNPYNVLVAGSGAVVNWAGGVRSMGTNNIAWGAYMRPDAFNYAPTGGTRIMALPSREFTISPSDGYLKPEALDMTLTYDQRINNNMDFEIAGYRYVDDQYTINFEGAYSASYDLNRQLPNGSVNPNFGKLYSDFFLDKQVQNHWVNEVRGQFSYHFDTELWKIPLNQVFSASLGEQVTEYDARQYNADWIANDTGQANWTSDNWTRDMVWGRMYWDKPQAAFSVPAGVIYNAMPFNWYDFNSKQTIKYYGAFSQTRLWDDRLNISLGLRRDTYDVTKIGLRGPSNVPVLGNGAGNTYSVGAIGYVTEWLGVYANLSDNYQPAAGGLAPSLFGELRGASFGKGKNVGVRVSTKDGKYYASATWYKDTATDVIGGDNPDFQGIWNDYLAAGGTARDIGPAGQINGVTAQMQYNTIYDVEYKGFEFDMTANPTKNIRLQVHYALPKGERTNDGIDGLRYFTQHLSEWQAAASGGSAASQKLASDLATAQHNYTIWAIPTLAGGVVKSMWNAFATYSFKDDALKGLDIGFGATQTGARQIDQVNRTTAYTTESLLLGYSRAINTMGHKLNARLQLNVDNLFGNKTLVFQNYNGTQPMDYNFIPARKVTLTARFEF
ncbi:MAG TPA: TonB-dependent receptor plug domain-containing protein [Opitutaceae bacterium]|nr:TonB-dependent receptor plug domain-containing protein [Opitutaceae bacterium]